MTYPPPPPNVPVAVLAPRSTGAAVALELVPGLFGVFGIGSIYAGRIAQGIVLMVSFWALFWVNFALAFVFIGFVTMPLTWVAYLILGPVAAARAVEAYNSVTGPFTGARA